ncbi:hypothetical protein RTH46_12515 [Pseudomonas sp. zfem004]|uniref:hypothetical protein n=1 Tax=Pseudomonas sp. zfem004 TaxID=3078199 RepID=UPI002927AE26|nr:hypothetical protein [Pseudomonas sp. zfem004]MDU9403308.1 hypothetical protein [Pseudomonas sp. zfem004]
MKSSLSLLAASGVFKGVVVYKDAPEFKFNLSEVDLLRYHGRLRILAVQDGTMIILEFKDTPQTPESIPVNYAEIEGGDTPFARGHSGKIKGLINNSTTLKCESFTASLKDHKGQDVEFSGRFEFDLTK